MSLHADMLMGDGNAAMLTKLPVARRVLLSLHRKFTPY
jgi:hypothetical protein